MQVTVKLFGALRQYLPAGSSFNSCELTTAERPMLDQLLQILPIPDHKAYLVILNDEKINKQEYASTQIEENDEVVLLPPIKGG
ncbi:MAG: MoaD/ThiS family protein [Gammaproteobacteria bacterium]|nr:MoaD/ThiS family protein [Gammaproteobacteria bacterium]